jgi:deoxyhypusine synthase
LKRVAQMRIRAGMTVGELANEMRRTGVMQAGRIGKAVEITAEIFSNPEYTTFITLSGPLTHGGLRLIFSDLVRKGYVDAVVTNGANMVGDLIEAMGEHHYIGEVDADDEELYEKGINRAYDIYFEGKVFEKLEKFVYKILDDIPEEIREGIPINGLLKEIGLRLIDKDSILYNAAKMDVPIFSPGFLDCMLGIPLYMYSKQKKLIINPLRDFDRFTDMVYEAKKSGAIILGGGTPKHHTQYMHTLREGLDAAIQISSARVEDGSLSGAPLKESISWGKLKGEQMEMTSTIFGEVTSIFPLIVAAALEKVEGTRAPRV